MTLAQRADDVAQFKRAEDHPQQHHSRQKRQPGECRRQQRHARAPLRVLLVVQKSDEQERSQPRELPRHKQHQQIARQHRHQHRAHEEQQIAVKPPVVPVVIVQIMGRVKRDQHADARHHQRKKQREPVWRKGRVDAQARQPRPGDRLACGGGQLKQPHHRPETHHGACQRQPANPGSQPTRRQRHEAGQYEGREEKGDEKRWHGCGGAAEARAER